jgi:hypothetical protein
VLSGLSHKDYITRYVSKHTVFVELYTVFNHLAITAFSTAFLVKSLSAICFSCQPSIDHVSWFLVSKPVNSTNCVIIFLKSILRISIYIFITLHPTYPYELSHVYKDKIVPVLKSAVCHEDVGGTGCIDPPLLFSSALPESKWSDSRTCRFNCGEIPRYPLDKRPVGPRVASDGVKKRKFLTCGDSNSDSSAFRSAASRNTDCANPAPFSHA